MVKNVKTILASVVIAASLSVIAGGNAHADDLITVKTNRMAAVQEGFKDLDNSHWAYDAVLWAKAEGIVSGYLDQTFKPNQTVSEAEFLAMVIRLVDIDGDNAKKVTPGIIWSDLYYKLAAIQNYPVTGNRDQPIKRTNVAELVTATKGFNYKGDQAIQFLLGNSLSNGKTEATIEGFKGNDTLTRAEAAKFLKNMAENSEVIAMFACPKEPSDPKILPPLPKLDDKIQTNTTDDQLEALRQKIEGVVTQDGYKATTSPHEFSVSIKDINDKTILNYADYSSGKGDEVVTIYKPIQLDNGNLDMGKVNETIKVLNQLGVTSDQRLTDAIVSVSTTSTTELTIKYDKIIIWVAWADGGIILDIKR